MYGLDDVWGREKKNLELLEGHNDYRLTIRLQCSKSVSAVRKIFKKSAMVLYVSSTESSGAKKFGNYFIHYIRHTTLSTRRVTSIVLRVLTRTYTYSLEVLTEILMEPRGFEHIHYRFKVTRERTLYFTRGRRTRWVICTIYFLRAANINRRGGELSN